MSFGSELLLQMYGNTKRRVLTISGTTGGSFTATHIQVGTVAHSETRNTYGTRYKTTRTQMTKNINIKLLKILKSTSIRDYILTVNLD